MSSYTQIIYQIIFATKYREKVLLRENRPQLFNYIHGILINKKCRVYCINGVEDHIHIATDLHPSVALASLVKDIKIASAMYIRAEGLFPEFSSWAIGYSAFTYTIKERDRLIAYIERQEMHHINTSSREELISLLNEHGVQYIVKYLE